jgi:hypothetical protein
MALLLGHYDLKLSVIVETDASDFAIGAVQLQTKDTVYPVAFNSRKMTTTELKYNIYDKQMLAIVSAFNKCRWNVEGAEHSILVFSNQKNLEYFTTTKVLHCRKSRLA